MAALSSSLLSSSMSNANRLVGWRRGDQSVNRQSRMKRKKKRLSSQPTAVRSSGNGWHSVGCLHSPHQHTEEMLEHDDCACIDRSIDRLLAVTAHKHEEEVHCPARPSSHQRPQGLDCPRATCLCGAVALVADSQARSTLGQLDSSSRGAFTTCNRSIDSIEIDAGQRSRPEADQHHPPSCCCRLLPRLSVSRCCVSTVCLTYN